MCNLYQLEAGPDAIRRIFEGVQLPLGFPEGVPNFQPRDVRITEQAPVVRWSAEGSAELIERRWSWPGPKGKPVYNFRSEGRAFGRGRCLIPADSFYEFTTPNDPKAKRKDRWQFRTAGGEPFAIAGLLRTDPGVGEAFTMLTTSPGPDVAPFHSRQIVVVTAHDWRGWLDGSEAECLARPLPAGTFSVERA
ncbi:MAG: SOS response-associated peptidase [Sphingomicrobium sp.]